VELDAGAGSKRVDLGGDVAEAVVFLAGFDKRVGGGEPARGPGREPGRVVGGSRLGEQRTARPDPLERRLGGGLVHDVCGGIGYERARGRALVAGELVVAVLSLLSDLSVGVELAAGVLAFAVRT